MDIRKEAVGLQSDLTREMGVTPTIRWGLPGQLDVVVDGTVVFSKKAMKRMPQPGEIARRAKDVRR
jgi:hypothetical protein